MIQSESTASEIRRLIAEINKLDVHNDLVQEAKLGMWAFKELKTEFNQMKVLLAKLDAAELLKIHLPILSELSRDLNNLLTTLKSISKFVVAQGNAEQEKNQLIYSFNEWFGKILENSIKAFQMLKLTSDGKEELSESRSAEQLILEIKTTQEKLKLAEIEMESALAAVRAKSRDIGIERYSQIFGDESKKNSNTSIVWLFFIALLLITGIFYGYKLNEELTELATDGVNSKLLDNNNYILQITIIRLLIITIMFYALTICMKNYRAQKHNQVINRHRHNALITFETFSAGATDEGTKNAVLLEATRAIFGNQPTGFGSRDSDVESPTSQVIEILKTRMDTKSSSN